MSFPPIPMVPEPLRGQSFVLVEATYIGDEADGAALIQPLRKLGPAMDTFATSPSRSCAICTWIPRRPCPAPATA